MKRLVLFILIPAVFICVINRDCSAQPPFTRTDSDGAVYSWVNTTRKLVALTFDDGPHPVNTEKILEVLRENGVRATFFVIGRNVSGNPGIVGEIAEDGHEIGNHTFDHKCLRKKNADQITDELRRTEEAVAAAGGVTSRLIRPPEGKYSENVVRAAQDSGYTVVLWSVDTRDWAHRSAEAIIKTVEQNVRSGDIILCHDFISGEAHTAEALGKLIPALKEDGFEFVTVSELIAARDN